MSRLAWWAHRLRAMSPVEVGWRAACLVRDRIPARPVPDGRLLGEEVSGWDEFLERFRAGTGRPVLLDRSRAETLAAACPGDVADVVAAADRVVEHRFTFFGHPEVRLADPVDWNHDPIVGVHWPAVPSAGVDRRSGEPKWIWELNRLQHLPWLAQAWLFTGRREYADAAFAQLDSWIDQNPPGTGIAWNGVFEAGVRATSVAVALQGLRDAPGLSPERFRRYVHMLAESARRCWAGRSRYSSANNHLVGELGGVITVATLFPELAHARRWRERAVRALAAEHRQILPDGSGAEQSVGYQVYTADVFCVVLALLAGSDEHTPTELGRAVARSASYLAALVGVDDPEPRYGDDDGSFALRLDATGRRTVRAHLATAAAHSGDAWVARARDGGDLVARWLGGAPDPDPDSAAATPGSFRAEDGGLVVLRSGTRRVTMDVGPLGYLSLAAHGHADALALTLSADGHELVTDPGTASYYGNPAWRAEHRGTGMHATVVVDGLDQSVTGGPFLWTHRASVSLRHVDLDRGIVEAEHDGYRRLSSPVLHRRWLVASPDGGLLVVDLVDGAGAHVVGTRWPLHPALDLEATSSGGHVATRGSVPVLWIEHTATVDVTPVATRGGSPGSGGWWSDRLESRVPAWCVGVDGVTSGRAVLVTVLSTTAHAAPRDVRVSADPDRIAVGWSEQDQRWGVVVDPSRRGRVDVHRPVDAVEVH